MNSHVTWSQVRADRVARVARDGGEEAVAAAKDELTAQVVGYRLAEVRRGRGFTQAQIAERMGVPKGRVSPIERGKISGQDVLARYASAWAAGCTRPATSTTATSPPSPDSHSTPATGQAAAVQPSTTSTGVDLPPVG